jgi:hypothetical protein
MQQRINTLLMLEEEREKVKSKFLAHQQIVKRWFDKHKAKEKNFEVGDLVLKWDGARWGKRTQREAFQVSEPMASTFLGG